MAERTLIPWCDNTFNGWWGCTPASPGCLNCYARAKARRWFPGNRWWLRRGDRRVLSDAIWRQPHKWNAQAEQQGRRLLVFASSMADILEPRKDLNPLRSRLFRMCEQTPWLWWLLLTKHPGRYLDLTPWGDGPWPPNVWAGTSVEDQPRAEERIGALCRVPARVRFLSCEPLIAPITLKPWLSDPPWVDGPVWPPSNVRERTFDWVIIGGESGPRHRPMDVGWATGLADECRLASVPVFMKQDSGTYPDRQGRIPDEYWTRLHPALRSEVPAA